MPILTLKQSKSEFQIHKGIIYSQSYVGLRTERNPMKNQNKINRKALKNKMAQALNDEIRTLPAGMQEILVDDLVTAFQNRVKVVKQAVVNQATSNLQCYVELGVKVTQ